MRTMHQGFTLMELVIVMAIIGILAAIAYPTYQDQVRKSRRVEAESVLLEAAQWMERFYTANNRYDQDTGGVAVSLPDAMTRSPKKASVGESDSNPIKYYAISFDGAAQRNTYTLIATPRAGTDQVGDPCVSLTLTNTGIKAVKNAKTGYDAARCWQK